MAIVQYQAYHLANIIKTGFFNDRNIIVYNINFESKFEDCVDFVSMHYDKSLREGKFWQFVKETYKPTENILFREQRLKEGPLLPTSHQDFQIFTGTNWTTWMYQLGYEVGADKSLSKETAGFLLEKYYNTVEQSITR